MTDIPLPKQPTRERIDALILWQFAVGILLLGTWEVVGIIFNSNWISRPSFVAARLGTWFVGDLYVHLYTTTAEMAAGMVLGTVSGVVVGLLLGRAPVTSLILRPIIVALYSVPLISLAPLFTMLFGLDMLPKIVLVAVVVFFLLFFNTFTGAQAVDADLVDSLEVMGATSLERFRKVIAPACTAWILSGIKIALPYALVAATTGEMLAARRGVGFLLAQAASKFDMTALYAALFILMMMGLLLTALVLLLEQRLLRWREPF